MCIRDRVSQLKMTAIFASIGGGIMGLGSAWYLSQRGYKVTVLEQKSEVAMGASSINGAMLCPSMCASWASLKLVSEVHFFLIFHIFEEVLSTDFQNSWGYFFN